MNDLPADVDMRLMVEPYLHNRWKRVGRALEFKARDAAGVKRWRKAALARLKSITGYDTMIQSPLKPRITETVQREGYTRQRVEIQVEPGVIMPFYVLIPEGKGPFPAVICPHGHDSGGKYCPAGAVEIPGVAERVKVYDYDYGVQFVRTGMVAFCPDARGFGERQEAQVKANAKGNVFISSCQYINQMAMPLGQCVTGMWAWDLHRLVDYVETRKDCIPGKVACAGLSGGGLQTLWATALDEPGRIKAAVVSGYFYGYKQSLLRMHWNCSCNYVPHLYELMDVGDVGALIAPRPLLIETGTLDDLNGPEGMPNVTRQVKQAGKAYAVLGAKKNLVHDIFVGPHKWHGKNAVPWLREQLA